MRWGREDFGSRLSVGVGSGESGATAGGVRSGPRWRPAGCWKAVGSRSHAPLASRTPPPLCPSGYSSRLLWPHVACPFHVGSRSAAWKQAYGPPMEPSLRPFISSHKQSGRAAARVSLTKRGGFVWSAVWPYSAYSASILFQTIRNLAARPPASEGKRRGVCVVSCLVLSPLERAHAWFMALATLGAGGTRCRGGYTRIPTREPRRADTPGM